MNLPGQILLLLLGVLFGVLALISVVFGTNGVCMKCWESLDVTRRNPYGTACPRCGLPTNQRFWS